MIADLLSRCAQGRIRAVARALSSPCLPPTRGEGFDPFFIVGSGRSGNTLLRRLLISDETHIPPEIWSTGPVIQRLRSWGWLVSWDVAVKYAITALLTDSEFQTEFKREMIERVSEISEIDPSERSIARLLASLYRTHAEWVGNEGRRWGDKTPLNSFYLAEIHAVFPDARYVHLVRDGADVASSYVEAGLQPTLSAAATRWVDSVTAVRSFAEKHPDRTVTVRYEDLVRDPTGSVKEVCRFLELPFPADGRSSPPHAALGDLAEHPHHRNAFEPVTDAFIGKGRSKLGENDLERLAPIMNDELRRFGYPSV